MRESFRREKFNIIIILQTMRNISEALNFLLDIENDCYINVINFSRKDDVIRKMEKKDCIIVEAWRKNKCQNTIENYCIMLCNCIFRNDDFFSLLPFIPIYLVYIKVHEMCISDTH